MFYVLIVIAAIAKAIMDRSEEGAPFIWGGPSSLWSKNESWVRKWKNGDPAQGERWFTSSTVTVFLTDPWHAAQFVFLNALIGSVFFYDGITASKLLDFIITSVLFRLIFEAVYRLVRK